MDSGTTKAGHPAGGAPERFREIGRRFAGSPAATLLAAVAAGFLVGMALNFLAPARREK